VAQAYILPGSLQALQIPYDTSGKLSLRIHNHFAFFIRHLISKVVGKIDAYVRFTACLCYAILHGKIVIELDRSFPIG
jgi:hypothetical protein